MSPPRHGILRPGAGHTTQPGRWSRRRVTCACTGVLIIGLVFLAGAAAAADTLHLKGGEKLIGKVLSDDKEKVIFESQTLGKLEVSRDRIERVEFDPATKPSTMNDTTGKPFIPPVPIMTNPPPAAPPAAASPTNTTAKGWSFWPVKKPQASTPDWIQLKSGEWLRGKLFGMQNRQLEFDSDELDDLTFDWKDVHQVIMPKALVSFGDRESAWGKVRVDRENVTVSGGEEVTFPRYDLVGITPGSPRELDYWSGSFNAGVNLRSGNTEQVDLVSKAKLARRTPGSRFRLEFSGNFSELEGVESVNNRRISEALDFFLTRRFFLRIPQTEYYHDPFQNIDARLTVGAGVGYYLIDTPKTEWLVSGGPGYRNIRFDTVQPGEPATESTPAVALESSFDTEVTKRTDFELGYQLIIANDASGGATHHAVATFEIDLTRSLDLDLSFTWDRISNPQTDASGAIPAKDDFRIDLSIGVEF